MKPVLFATGHLPAYRVGAFTHLHELEGIELALFGGRALHGGPESQGLLRIPHRRLSPAAVGLEAASGRYRAVIVPTGGRLAPAAGWAGARLAAVPLLLWASLWAHPRSLAHALTYLPLRRLYRGADALVTYGPHVSAYVRARGATNVFEAPQSVDNGFWGQPQPGPAPGGPVGFLFVGRPDPEKGLAVLGEAWRSSRLEPVEATLTLAGPDREQALAAGLADLPGVAALGPRSPEALRELYGRASVLVVPSVATRTFREPWGLVVNEAMNQGTAVIASDAVGAAAGGLVRDGRNGLVVAAGDSGELARAIAQLAGDAGLRDRMSAAAVEDVATHSHEAWAEGFSRALAELGLSRRRW